MVTTTTTPPKRVAIIGSGLAGITMAYLLTHPDTAADRFDVTIYEAAPTVGMDSHGMDVPCGCEQCAAEPAPPRRDANGHVQQRMDSPFRMFIDTYYGTLVSMYRHLGIPFARASLDVCFARLAAAKNPASEGEGSTERLQPSQVVFSDKFYSLGSRILRIPTILTRPWTQWTSFRLYLDRKRFIATARRLRTSRQLPRIQCTLGDYLVREGYSDLFIYDHLVPVLSVYMSAKHDRILAMPAATILDVYGRPESHVGWCTVTDGIATVCTSLLQYLPKHKQRWSTKIVRIERQPDTNTYSVYPERQPDPDVYDVVILATPASVSMRLVATAAGPTLPHATDLLKHLAHFTYEPVSVVVHSDTSVLIPGHSRGLTIAYTRDDTEATTSVNHLRNLPAHCPPLLQTTNPLSHIDPAKIQGKFEFPRARLTLDTERALDKVYAMQGHKDLYIIGAPMFPGVPLLEGCVASAVDVAGRLGVERPWQVQDGEYQGYEKGREGSIVDAFLLGDLTYCDPKGSRYVTKDDFGHTNNGLWVGWWALAAGAAVVGGIVYKAVEG